jgi:Protein of unknown function (DUF3089)
MKLLISSLFILSFMACHQQPVVLTTHFNENNIPPEVDYTKGESWAALPDRKDLADSLPVWNGLVDKQSSAKADVFFIHPTIFTYKPNNNFEWNADVNDAALNLKTDYSTILNQATAFNGAGRIYAPRYRQAHLYSFYTTNLADSKQALDLAYLDVKKAFEYYLKNYNAGRPIIIASHSQGTVHAKRLLKEYFDGTDLQKRLVMAYIIGIAVAPETFSYLKPTSKADQLGCYAVWNTFATGFYPKNYNDFLVNSVCTNPLIWSSDETYVANTANLGGIGQKFKFHPNITDAQVNKGLLWIKKPNLKGSFFVNTKRWHVADINFYWMNIRENAALRVKTYFDQHPN